MILMDGEMDIINSLGDMDRDGSLDSLWPWDQSFETSGLNYGGLLLDVLGDSKQNLVRNDVVLSEGSGDHIPRQEHSYSCSIASDGDSVPSSPLSLDMQDDMESECFPCIPLNRANQQAGGRKEPDQDVFIKSEPSSPPPSFSRPYISSISTTLSTSPTFSSIIKLEPESGFQIKQENGSNLSKPNQLSLLKPTPITTRILCPKVSIKLEDPSSSSLNSCNIAVSNSNSSNSGSSMLVSRQRILPALRHTISSPLISTQLKGSSGVLYLTEEEKRTLISEGYPIPTKLPLSKAEERSLKKIRRKIKNKISAQESRRKKKEYMDSLERKYDIMQSEANSWKSKAEALQAQNAALAKQVSELQQKLNMATKTGSEISFILPESIDLEENILQGKNRVSEFQELTANCLDIDVD